MPADPSNRVADDPAARVLGQRLFFDTRLSADGMVACGTCHRPDLAFTDGLPLGRGVGTAERNTMTVQGAAYAPWLFWDGRKDSLWSQALAPIETPAEHGITRVEAVRVVRDDPDYRAAYEALFGPLADGPEALDRAFANIGKAIAAYERLLVPGPSRFDGFAAALLAGDRDRADAMLTTDEQAGLRLFISERARCTRCHNGPLFSDFSFHNTGVPDPGGRWADRGRAAAIREVRADPFNCLGRFSDASADDCAELRFVKTEDVHFLRGFRTPTLRNLGLTGPYMHAGQIGTLEAAVDHYDQAPAPKIGTSEIEPLGLSARERRQLAAFLRTLDGLVPEAAPAPR